MKKQEPTTRCLQGTNFKYKDVDWLKGWEMIFCAIINYNKAGVAISDNVDFRTRNMTRYKIISDKRVKSSRRLNSFSYALLRSTKIHRAIINRPKVRN